MNTIDEDITPTPGGEEEPVADLFRDVFDTDDGITAAPEGETAAPEGEEEPLADLFRDVFELVDETVAQVTDAEVDRAARRVLTVGRGKGSHRPDDSPMGSRRRKRRAAAAVAVGLWLGIFAAAGSVLLTRVLLLLASLAVAGVMTTSLPSVGGQHSWVRRLANRPWRDGRDVLNLALRHLRDVFIEMPGKVLLAPSAVELLMNPGDLASLTRLIEVELVDSIAAECYAAEVAARAARLVNDGPVKVSVTGDPAIPAGRYRLRRDQRVDVRPADQFYAYGHDGSTRHDPAGAASVRTDPTMPGDLIVNPPLRLVTNGSVTETRVSGARAGRGGAVELRLPEELTVSRVHAEFIFARGQWWIIGCGRNGLVLNGTPLSKEHVVRPGDSIYWGCQDGALMSRVEIGAGQGFYAEEQC